MFEYRQALVRMRRGDSDRDIARSKQMGRRKLAGLRARAISEGWLEAQSTLPEEATLQALLGGSQRRAASTISSAETHRALVAQWLDQGVSAVAIHGALKRDHGFRGSYSAVYRLVCDIAAKRTPEATVRLSFAPGEAAQVDFGAGPHLPDPGRSGQLRRSWCFVMTLCYSRHQYVEFVFDQTVSTWLGCHRRAFEWFCGVPRRLIIDNAKCAITRACARDPEVQRAYYECAEGYGFKIDACPPGEPQKKGIVESGVKYVKRNFLALRSFRSLEDLNAQAKRWVIDEAGLRVHGTTRRIPLSEFETERRRLRALPAVAPALGEWHQVIVHRDCHIAQGRCLYSVPFALVGQTLWLKLTDALVSLYDAQHRLVAVHARARTPGERRTLPDHLPPHAQAFFAHDRTWCASQAKCIGPACAEFIERLLGDRVLERLRAAQGVIGLTRQYGEARVEAACKRALAFQLAPTYRGLKHILTGGFDQHPLVEHECLLSTRAHVPHARFALDAKALFGAPSDVASSERAFAFTSTPEEGAAQS